MISIPTLCSSKTSKAFATGLIIISAYVFFSMRISSKSVLYNVCSLGFYLMHHGHDAISTSDGWFFYRPNVGSILRPWPNSAANVKSICALHDTLGKLGIRLVVVPVPDKELIVQYYSPFSVDVASNQRKRFIDEIKRNGVSAVDLVPLFIAHRSENQMYRKEDTHWDQKGISYAAEAVASMVAVPANRSHAPCFFLKDTLAAEPGDLSQMVGDSSFTNRKCTMVIGVDGQRLSDSLSGRIMIFGDSFAIANKKYGAGFGALVSYFAQEKSFTYATLMASVSGPRLLLKFLKSHRQAPEVIVWIFASRVLREKIEGF